MQGLPANKQFFSSWGLEMAYVFGVITADGCIIIKRTRNDGSKQYCLNITSKDLKLLQKIKEAMKAQQKIGTKLNGQGKKRCYQLQIGHQNICKDLLSLGIKPNKSHNFLGPVNVPEEFFPAFVRGFFDGDGSVYIYDVNGTPQIKASFVSTDHSFLKDFNQKLCSQLKIPIKTIHKEEQKGKRVPKYGIYFYISDCEKLAQLIYGSDSTLYLPRKRKIFQKWENIERRDYNKRNYPSKIGQGAKR